MYAFVASDARVDRQQRDRLRAFAVGRSVEGFGQEICNALLRAAGVDVIG
jgi:hypothetical protein